MNRFQHQSQTAVPRPSCKPVLSLWTKWGGKESTCCEVESRLDQDRVPDSSRNRKYRFVRSRLTVLSVISVTRVFGVRVRRELQPKCPCGNTRGRRWFLHWLRDKFRRGFYSFFFFLNKLFFFSMFLTFLPKVWLHIIWNIYDYFILE